VVTATLRVLLVRAQSLVIFASLPDLILQSIECSLSEIYFRDRLQIKIRLLSPDITHVNWILFVMLSNIKNETGFLFRTIVKLRFYTNNHRILGLKSVIQ
jgi:hypothetical protein